MGPALDKAGIRSAQAEVEGKTCTINFGLQSPSERHTNETGIIIGNRLTVGFGYYTLHRTLLHKCTRQSDGVHCSGSEPSFNAEYANMALPPEIIRLFFWAHHDAWRPDCRAMHHNG